MTDAPTPHHLIDLPDGRRLAVDETGPADGPVVVLLHSAPGSRLFDPDPAVTAAAEIRLVTLDRPGYGASTALGDGAVPTIAGQADDVVAALDHLGVDEAALAGWSAGGRVAVGVAARHPERVRALAVIGTPAPDDLSWIPEEQQAMLEPLRADRATATARLAEMLGHAVGGDPADGLGFIAGTGDEELLTDRPVRDRVVTMLTEAFRPGADGTAADVVADQIAEWGFDPASVGTSVHLFYSEDDFVRPSHGEWWAEALVDSTTHVTSGVGHLLVVTEWAAVLAALGHPAH